MHLSICIYVCITVMLFIFKSPQVTGGLMFFVRFRRRRSVNTFQLSGKTPDANFFK